MYLRRLAWLLVLAAAAVVPEGLVRHADPRIGFQAWMVVQLLGVIVAAIGVAAAFSALGLGIVRLGMWPVRDRPSVFVAWSFLKSARPGTPWPARLTRALAREVDGLQRDGAHPQLMARLGVGLATLACAGGLAWLWLQGEPLLSAGWPTRLVRNLVVALGLHGALLLCAALPWRRARILPAAVVGLAALSALALLGQIPLLTPYVHGVGLAFAAVAAVSLLTWVLSRRRRARAALARRAGLLCTPLGLAAVAWGLATHAPVGWSVGAVFALLGGYLLLSSQPKVTVPVFVSIVGVASGTWALIVVLSVMGGFAGDLRAKMLVANAHALVERPGRGQPLTDAAGVSAGLRRVPGVVSVSPQVRGDAIVSSPFNVNNFVNVRGVDPSLAEVRRQVGGTVVTGSLALLSQPERMGAARWRARRDPEAPSDLPDAPTAGELPAATVDDGKDIDDSDLDALLELAPGPAQPAPPSGQPPPRQPPPRQPPPRQPPPRQPPMPPPAGPPPAVAGAGPKTQFLALDSEGRAHPVAQDAPAAPGGGPDADADLAPLDQLIGAPGDDAQPSTDPATHGGSEDLGTADLPVPSGVKLDRALGRTTRDLDEPAALPLLLDGALDEGPSDVPIAPGILLGVELARALQVELGDRVEVITPDADIGPTGLRPRVRTFRVAGTFETGLYEADSKVAYIDLVEASRYFNLEGAANVIELRLAHPEEPDAVLAQVKRALAKAGAPADTELLDWRDLNRSLFSALAFERLVIFLVLALIILVASFSIVSALTMVILQKQSGIAMLQAMGAGGRTVRAAFVQMGGVIGMIGTSAGLILGLATCLLVDALGIQLPEAYYVRTLPVAINAVEVGAVVVASLVISLAATVFPATSAARLSPLEGLRHE